MNLKTALARKHLLFDGAMGTYLQMSGLTSNDLAEEWNISHSEIIKGIHASYVLAGANVITTNTFGANEINLARHGAAGMGYEYTCAAVDNAKAAAQDKAFVVVDIGPTGEMLAPNGKASLDEIYRAYVPQIKAAADRKADGILIETMIDLAEARIAYLAARENCDLPVIVSFSIDQNDTTVMGNTACVLASVFDSMGADCIALNCSGGPEDMFGAVKKMKERTAKPILVQPNAGLPVTVNDKLTFPYTPKDFQIAMQAIVNLGVQHIGGCCGTTPDHIRQLNAMFDKNVLFDSNEPLHPYMLASSRNCFPINYSLPLPYVVNPNDSDDEIIDNALGFAVENDVFYLDLSHLPMNRIPALITLINSFVNYPLVLATESLETCWLALRYYNGIAGVIPNALIQVEDLHKYGAVLI